MRKKRLTPQAPSTLDKSTSQSLHWRESLAKRNTAWNTGLSKKTDPRVLKISETMKKRKIDNFRLWRENARKAGLIPQFYRPFKKSVELAYLIGMSLGDGHICRFPRTEKLEITLGTDKPKLIVFTAMIVEQVFSKEPKIMKRKGANAVRITLYQKNISKRLDIPIGNRGKADEPLPGWIRKKRLFLLAYLRGLYEAEASLSIHLPTCTYNFAFHNNNCSLLSNVETSLRELGLHPEVRSNAIRLRRRDEVKYFSELISFRKYSSVL